MRLGQMFFVNSYLVLKVLFYALRNPLETFGFCLPFLFAWYFFAMASITPTNSLVVRKLKVVSKTTFCNMTKVPHLEKEGFCNYSKNKPYIDFSNNGFLRDQNTAVSQAHLNFMWNEMNKTANKLEKTLIKIFNKSKKDIDSRIKVSKTVSMGVRS